MEKEIYNNLKSLKVGKEVNVQTKCCPIGPEIDGQIHPIGFIGKNHAEALQEIMKQNDLMKQICKDALDIVNSYSHIPAMYVLCQKLLTVIDL